MDTFDYNKITLRPIDDQKKKDFQMFRNDDVIEMYRILTIGSAVGTTLSVLSFLHVRTFSSAVQMLFGAAGFASYLVIFLMRRRIKTFFMPIAAIQYILL